MKSLLLVAGLCLSGLLHAAELQVRVETVDASGGQLLLAVFDSEAAWKEHKTPVAQAHLAAPGGCPGAALRAAARALCRIGHPRQQQQ